MSIEEVKMTTETLNHFIKQTENIEVALYELNILHKKVNPSKHSSIEPNCEGESK